MMKPAALPSLRRYGREQEGKEASLRFSGRFGPILLLQLLLGAAMLAILFWRVDIVGAFQRMPHVNYWWVLPGLLVFTLSKAIHAYRWRFFLRHRTELPTKYLFGVFLVSNLANALLPLRAGDILRIELPNRRFSVPRAEMASSVLLVESLLDGVTFVILLSAGLLFLDVPPALRPTLVALTLFVVTIFVASVGAARFGHGWRLEHSRLVRWLPERSRLFVARRFTEVLAGMASLRTVQAALIAVAISIAGWLAELSVYALLGQAFGLDLSLADTIVVMVAANLAGAIPITPWNVGPYEVVVTEALVLLGADRDVASGYAIGSHLLLLLWIGITGVAAMWALDLRMRDLLHRRRPVDLQITILGPEGEATDSEELSRRAR